MIQEQGPLTLAEISEWVKLIASIATLIISSVNLVFAVFIFKKKDKKEDKESERKLRLDWFNKLILDSSLIYFHGFFEELATELNKLRENNLSSEAKSQIIENAKDIQKNFRIRFIDSLLAVNEDMYDKMLEMSDRLIDDFTHIALDSGVNLSHPPKFEELVTEKLSSGKTEMIKELFKYNGEVKTVSLIKK